MLSALFVVWMLGGLSTVLVAMRARALEDDKHAYVSLFLVAMSWPIVYVVVNFKRLIEPDEDAEDAEDDSDEDDE